MIVVVIIVIIVVTPTLSVVDFGRLHPAFGLVSVDIGLESIGS